jgi:hypothetical protein
MTDTFDGEAIARSRRCQVVSVIASQMPSP